MHTKMIEEEIRRLIRERETKHLSPQDLHSNKVLVRLLKKTLAS